MSLPRRSFWRAALVLLACAIAVQALTPHPPTTLHTGWDKLDHVLAFAALGLCAQSAAADPRRPAWAWLGLVLAFGAFIEAAQAQIPGRYAEAADLLADTLGIACGAVSALLCWRRMPVVRRERGL